MTPTLQAPVLIVGGSGIVGSQAARALRRLHPALPLVIGGRDMTKAEAIAKDLGNASALSVDVALADLGINEDRAFSAVVVFLKDHWLNSMRFAQRLGVPYISLSSGAFEIGPEVAQYIHASDKAPILLASHWLAGAALFPTLHYAKAFRAVEVISRCLAQPGLFGIDLQRPAAVAAEPLPQPLRVYPHERQLLPVARRREQRVSEQRSHRRSAVG